MTVRSLCDSESSSPWHNTNYTYYHPHPLVVRGVAHRGLRIYTVPHCHHSKGISGKRPTKVDEDSSQPWIKLCWALRWWNTVMQVHSSASQASAGWAEFIAVFLTKPSLAILSPLPLFKGRTHRVKCAHYLFVCVCTVYANLNLQVEIWKICKNKELRLHSPITWRRLCEIVLHVSLWARQKQWVSMCSV